MYSIIKVTLSTREGDGNQEVNILEIHFPQVIWWDELQSVSRLGVDFRPNAPKPLEKLEPITQTWQEKIGKVCE